MNNRCNLGKNNTFIYLLAKIVVNSIKMTTKEIHGAQNRVRYTMNGFVIAIGTYVADLTEKSKEIAREIGKVTVDVGGSACKVPLANEYIDKVIDKGRVGIKRKTARC
ncbi:MAG: hypothetical protein PF450_06620 [Bacteroidales bacterium]|jgi:hypothetical protein|nr:hypothetical protein [Bacteroidales bacterium]